MITASQLKYLMLRWPRYYLLPLDVRLTLFQPPCMADEPWVVFTHQWDWN